ncbi:hypothetical protein GCM10027174_15970 [Salinifilum aidingensis]
MSSSLGGRRGSAVRSVLVADAVLLDLSGGRLRRGTGGGALLGELGPVTPRRARRSSCAPSGDSPGALCVISQ